MLETVLETVLLHHLRLDEHHSMLSSATDASLGLEIEEQDEEEENCVCLTTAASLQASLQHARFGSG